MTALLADDMLSVEYGTEPMGLVACSTAMRASAGQFYDALDMRRRCGHGGMVAGRRSSTRPTRSSGRGVSATVTPFTLCLLAAGGGQEGTRSVKAAYAAVDDESVKKPLGQASSRTLELCDPA